MLGKFFQKPEGDLADRTPPGQYLTKGFPVLTYGPTPSVKTSEWSLKVWGAAKPVIFSWSEFMSFPQSEFHIDFHCVTRWSRLDMDWTGIKVTDFMKLVELDQEASHVMLHCYGDYTTNLTLEEFAREDNFFAHKVFGEPISEDHGGPMRVVVPHLYAWKSAKWINGIEFLDHEELGFWERNGYHRRGEPWAEERYS